MWLQETKKFPSVPVGVCESLEGTGKLGAVGVGTRLSVAWYPKRPQNLPYFNAHQYNHLSEGWQVLRRKHAHWRPVFLSSWKAPMSCYQGQTQNWGGREENLLQAEESALIQSLNFELVQMWSIFKPEETKLFLTGTFLFFCHQLGWRFIGNEKAVSLSFSSPQIWANLNKFRPNYNLPYAHLHRTLLPVVWKSHSFVGHKRVLYSHILTQPFSIPAFHVLWNSSWTGNPKLLHSFVALYIPLWTWSVLFVYYTWQMPTHWSRGKEHSTVFSTLLLLQLYFLAALFVHTCLLLHETSPVLSGK